MTSSLSLSLSILINISIQMNENYIISNLNLYFFSYLEYLTNEKGPFENSPEISTSNPLTLLKLLRNFGHLIKNLGVNFTSFNAKVYAEIEENYLIYCSGSLERFVFETTWRSTKKQHFFENVEKPFKNVIALGIVVDVHPKYVRFLIESKLPNLQHIYYRSKYRFWEEIENIHYKNIEYFSLFPIIQMTTFPFSFGNLKYLLVGGDFELNDSFCDFIGNIKHLKTLKIMSFLTFDSDSFRKMMELKNVLSNIVEMQITFHRSITPELILNFLKQCQNLEKLSIHAGLKPNFHIFDSLSSNLENEWTSYTVNPYKNPFYEYGDSICYIIERKTTI